MYHFNMLGQYKPYMKYEKLHFGRLFQDYQFGDKFVYSSRNVKTNEGMYYIVDVNSGKTLELEEFTELETFRKRLEDLDYELLNIKVEELHARL